MIIDRNGGPAQQTWRGRRPAQPDPLNIETAIHRIRYCATALPPPLINMAERRAVIAMLTDAGWTAACIAEALGINQRSVVRHLHATRRLREGRPPNAQDTAAEEARLDPHRPRPSQAGAPRVGDRPIRGLRRHT